MQFAAEVKTCRKIFFGRQTSSKGKLPLPGATLCDCKHALIIWGILPIPQGVIISPDRFIHPEKQCQYERKKQPKKTDTTLKRKNYELYFKYSS